MRNALLSLVICFVVAGEIAAQTQRLAINDNRTPAGVLRDGVLTLDLQITQGNWHPDGESDTPLHVVAIGEVGKKPSVPGPLVRVPRGTLVRTTLHNTLNETMLVFGFGGSHALADTVRMQPNEKRVFELKADDAGNYMYVAMRYLRRNVSPETPPFGNDMAATGAFVVDEPGAPTNDRIFVISALADTMQMKGMRGRTARVVTLNGKAWPHTERLQYNVGETAQWRVINTSLLPHPMHLHGFYFDVLAHGTQARDTIYSPLDVRKAVTERLLALATMTIRWVPERAGNWLFHCHLPAHVALHSPIGPTKASTHHVMHDVPNGMSNLMMGITVHGNIPAEPASRRQIRLIVQEHDSIPGERGPRYSYSFTEAKASNNVGPTILLQQNEPTAITVVNRAREHTAVHWHGIELESFHDGAAGFGGYAKRISPLIAPRDSFTAHMTPPRAGTFIYHSHADELRQQPGGLYGPLIVVPPGTKYDAELEPVIIFGSATDTTRIMINGERAPTLHMKVGQEYRLRFINLTVNRPNMYAALTKDEQQLQWRLVAKDGADLPPHQAKVVTARQFMGMGETFDMTYVPTQPGELRIEARAGNGILLGWVTVTVH